MNGAPGLRPGARLFTRRFRVRVAGDPHERCTGPSARSTTFHSLVPGSSPGRPTCTVHRAFGPEHDFSPVGSGFESRASHMYGAFGPEHDFSPVGSGFESRATHMY